MSPRFPALRGGLYALAAAVLFGIGAAGLVARQRRGKALAKA